MNRQRIRFSPVAGLGLALTASLLCGCPERPTCPNCGFHNASFTVTPEDAEGLESATMETQVVHADGDCTKGDCPTESRDNVTCKVKTAGEHQVIVPVAMTERATSTVKIEVKNSKGTHEIPVTVGDKASEPPPKSICP